MARNNWTKEVHKKKGGGKGGEEEEEEAFVSKGRG
jgi:hypothetical protein